MYTYTYIYTYNKICKTSSIYTAAAVGLGCEEGGGGGGGGEEGEEEEGGYEMLSTINYQSIQRRRK